MKNFFAKYRIPISFILFIIITLGVFIFQRMQTSLFPDVTFPKITIIADNGEQPVDKMMITVTKPLEIAVKRVNGINIVRSSTNRGSSTIEAYFDENVDINQAKTRLNERINEIKNILPPTVNIVVEAMSQSIYPVIGYTVFAGRRHLKRNCAGWKNQTICNIAFASKTNFVKTYSAGYNYCPWKYQFC